MSNTFYDIYQKSVSNLKDFIDLRIFKNHRTNTFSSTFCGKNEGCLTNQFQN